MAGFGKMGEVPPGSLDFLSKCGLTPLAVELEGGAGGWRGWEEVRNHWGEWKLPPDRGARLEPSKKC